MSRSISRALALVIGGTLLFAATAFAQGVTTASMAGTVKDDQGQVVPGATVTATHEPSGTVYEAITQADGRFTIPGMRVGGPYHVSAALTGFTTSVQNNLTLSLGVTQNLDFTLVLGLTVFFGFFLIGMNFLVDVAYGFIDPRIRHS